MLPLLTLRRLEKGFHGFSCDTIKLLGIHFVGVHKTHGAYGQTGLTGQGFGNSTEVERSLWVKRTIVDQEIFYIIQ